MSTYNGEKYLREQLDSLLAQTYSPIEILIRDDSSSDGTVKIIKEYITLHENIRLIQGGNLGATNSFFALLAEADADYVAFCDQDDIWMPDKVEVAVQTIEAEPNQDLPILYCGNKLLVDGDGKELSQALDKDIRPGFGNALVENICTGCTSVLNRVLIEDIKAHFPHDAMFHDWWCYLVASHHGKVIFDETPHIYYRQHGNNEVGGNTSVFTRIRIQSRHVMKSRGKLGAQIREFEHFYISDEDESEEAILLRKVLGAQSLVGATKLLGNRKVYRQRNKLEALPMWFLFVTKLML